jgi:putative ABC transport system permease protein
MRVTDIIRRAGRSLRTAKVRTLLTSLAIGVGAFTITLSLAGGQGGRDYADAIVTSNTNVNEVLVAREVQETGIQEYNPASGGAIGGVGPGAGSSEGSGLEALTLDDINDIEALEHVESVTPNYAPRVNYITAEGQKQYVVSSVSTFSPSVTLEYAAGSVDGDLGAGDIVLSQEYAEVLGFGNAADAIGTDIILNATKQRTVFAGAESRDFTYTVKAVSSESGLAFRAQGSLLISSAAAKDLYDYINEGTAGYNKFVLASVIIDDPANAPEIKATLEDDGYTAQTSEDILGTVNTFINVLLGILLGFGALAVLTSVFGIINTQYISVLERTQQIGLMKALGMSARDVGLLFKFEAAWIGFLGGAIGAGLAFLAGTVANPLISEALGLGDIYLLVFTPWHILGVVAGLMIVAVVAGIFPSRKAARLDPIEALRTE